MQNEHMVTNAFQIESEMLPMAERWLASQGLMTKTEFSNPWGICDLVGCSFDPSRVNQRLAYGQRSAIGPPLRITLLLNIPDYDSRKSISVSALADEFAGLVDEKRIEHEVAKLESLRFVRRTRRGQLQKLNGWMPLQRELITVELKLSRIEEAVQQAMSNRWLTSKSYVALPHRTAARIANSIRQQQFSDSGIGLLAISKAYCRELIKPRRRISKPDRTALAHCIERFWRTFLQTLHH